MYSRIADLYRANGINASQEMLTSRAPGVDAFLKQASRSSIAGAVSLLKCYPSNDFADLLKATIREKDVTFGEAGVSNELKVLAASFCLELTEKASYSNKGLLAALLIIAGLRKTTSGHLESFLVQETREFLWRRSREMRRELLEDSELIVEIPEKEATFDAADLKTRFTSISKAIRAWSEVFEVLSDESNILWWIVGEEAHMPQKALAAMKPGELPFWAGKELATIIGALPGPLKIEAIIGRAIQKYDAGTKNKKKNLECLVGCIDKNQIETLSNAFSQGSGGDAELLKPLLPIHASIRRVHESGPDAWIKPLADNGDLEYIESMDPTDFAVQVYTESLALKALKTI